MFKFNNINKIVLRTMLVCICLVMVASCSKDETLKQSQPTPLTTPPPVSNAGEKDNSDVRIKSVLKRGYCGTGARWEFGDEGKLVIYGQGKMNDYEAEGDKAPPWAKLAVESIYINKGITYIGNFSFYNMENVSDITIPESVLEVGYDAFEKTSWQNMQTQQFVIVGDGVLIKYNGASQDVTIPYGVKFISNAFLENTDSLKHDGDITRVKMPDSVTKIGSHAFYSCRFLREVNFSSGLELVGESAFENSGIRGDIVLPETVRAIGDRAFAMCEEIYSIKLSDNLEHIGDFAFADSGINRFKLPKNVKSIGKNPFLNCSVLKKIETSQENEFFVSDQNGILYTKDMGVLIACPGGVGYNNPVVSSQVKEIRSYAFLGCLKIEVVSISDNVKKIGDKAFDGDVIIKAKANSTAQKYAQENGYTYEKF